jgi:hypothetical protein
MTLIIINDFCLLYQCQHILTNFISLTLQAGPSDVKRLCDELITRPRKKTLITIEKEEVRANIDN